MGKSQGGAPLGNQNARRGARWRDAINKALRQDPDALDRLARALVAKAAEGDLAALREIGDRLDGKATQSHEHGAMSGDPLPSEIRFVIVDPPNRKRPTRRR